MHINACLLYTSAVNMSECAGKAPEVEPEPEPEPEKESGKMCIRDRSRSPNGLVFGTPGSGKSMSCKREITYVMLTTKAVSYTHLYGSGDRR